MHWWSVPCNHRRWVRQIDWPLGVQERLEALQRRPAWILWIIVFIFKRPIYLPKFKMTLPINPHFWDFDKGAPLVIFPPASIPISWKNRDYLVFTAGDPRVWCHQKCQNFHWWLSTRQVDLFSGKYDLVYKKQNDKEIFELVFERRLYKAKKKKCPTCKGSGDYKSEFYTDDCSSCKGAGQIDDHVQKL